MEGRVEAEEINSAVEVRIVPGDLNAIGVNGGGLPGLGFHSVQQLKDITEFGYQLVTGAFKEYLQYNNGDRNVRGLNKLVVAKSTVYKIRSIHGF